MKLPIRNHSGRPLTLFVEPYCDEYEIPQNGEAIVLLGDGDPYSIDVHEGRITFWDEGADAIVEIVSERQNLIVQALSLVRVWLFNLDAKAVAAEIDGSIEKLEAGEGYLRSRAAVFRAFHAGFRVEMPTETALPVSVEQPLDAAYHAGRATASLNCNARRTRAFPGRGLGPFDTEHAKSTFEKAEAVSSEVCQC